MAFEIGELVYESPLAAAADVAGWRMEGPGAVSFPAGRMRLESTADAAEGQKANLVFWCPRDFPDHVAVTWDFWPIREPGLCILFFSARGRRGEDLFDPSLAPRSGPYDQYHHGDIDALHVSYFRRKHPDERAFQVCNLRKSYGFHMVAQGADPLPGVADAAGPYGVTLIKSGPHVVFRLRDRLGRELEIFRWLDDGQSHGPVLGGGKIGFRQMAPLIAEYANLRVHRVAPAD